MKLFSRNFPKNHDSKKRVCKKEFQVQKVIPHFEHHHIKNYSILSLIFWPSQSLLHTCAKKIELVICMWNEKQEEDRNIKQGAPKNEAKISHFVWTIEKSQGVNKKRISFKTHCRKVKIRTYTNKTELHTYKENNST